MTARGWCLMTGALWATTIIALGWLFVKGWTTPGNDRRTEILLAPAERDQILVEMRDLLKAVGGVISGLSDPEQRRVEVEQAARSAGMHMAADVNPVLMAKLPLAFKQMGMSVHRDMDGLAEAVAQGESAPQILNRLSSITARCTTCHDLYRFAADNTR
jgi:hypothetical protein